MKKTFLIVLIFVSIFLNACGNKELKRSAIEPDNIIKTVEYISDYSEMSINLEAQVENSSVILLGNISDIIYQPQENGMVLTYETVMVKECLKGSFETGDTVLVVKDQGCISIKDYIESFSDNKEREIVRQEFSNINDNDSKNKFIVIKEENDELSDVGDENLYFLEESNYFDENNSYNRLTGSYGEYKRLSNGKFIETVDKVNEQLSGEIVPKTFSSGSEEIEYNFDISYDELKAKINNYL